MRKEQLYNLLVENNVFTKVDVEKTKVFENDIVIEDYGMNKKSKIETDGMSNDDIIIALLAKQTLYIKTIKNIISGIVTVTVICLILMIFKAIS